MYNLLYQQLEYHNDAYVLTNKISDTNIREMRNNMSAEDAVEFDNFIERNWGKKTKKVGKIIKACLFLDLIN